MSGQESMITRAEFSAKLKVEHAVQYRKRADGLMYEKRFDTSEQMQAFVDTHRFRITGIKKDEEGKPVMYKGKQVEMFKADWDWFVCHPIWS